MSKVTVTAIELSETEGSVSGLLGLAVMRVVEGLTGKNLVRAASRLTNNLELVRSVTLSLSQIADFLTRAPLQVRSLHLVA